MKNIVLNTKLLLSYLFISSLILMTFSCGDDVGPDGEIIEDENLILDDSNQFLNFIIAQEEYDKFLADEGDYALVSNKVYEFYKDDFDFICIFTEEEEKPDGVAFGRNLSVKMDIEGLGRSLFDNTSSFGSDGKLKSIIYMPLVKHIKSGPFLHEIAHHWANKNFIPTTVSGHWGYSSVGGQLGGFDELVDLGNSKYLGKLNGKDGFGTFANGGNSLPYANAELYLMGMIPASELMPIQVAENPESGEERGVFTADKITTYTPEDLITQHGARNPSFDESQKSFKAMSIIISTSPIAPETKELAISNLENFSKQSQPPADWGNSNNFWSATNGVGTISFSISN